RRWALLGSLAPCHEPGVGRYVILRRPAGRGPAGGEGHPGRRARRPSESSRRDRGVADAPRVGRARLGALPPRRPAPPRRPGHPAPRRRGRRVGASIPPALAPRTVLAPVLPALAHGARCPRPALILQTENATIPPTTCGNDSCSRSTTATVRPGDGAGCIS